MVHPRETLEMDPTNSAVKPFAGMRTALTFESRSAEMPEFLHAFSSRNFAEVKALESGREKACMLLDHATVKEAEALAKFEETLGQLASKHRTVFALATVQLDAGEFSM
jgi:hypothetical protein